VGHRQEFNGQLAGVAIPRWAMNVLCEMPLQLFEGRVTPRFDGVCKRKLGVSHAAKDAAIVSWRDNKFAHRLLLVDRDIGRYTKAQQEAMQGI
jgi:hypothetical protein